MGIILGGSSASDLILDGNSAALYAGGNPPTKVWPTIREVVQITLGTNTQARDQFRAALTARGLSYTTVKTIPFDIEFVGTGSAQSMFYACQYLKSVPAMDTSRVTNMNSMFSYCRALTTAPAMDTSSVTRMNQTFRECRALTSVPDMYTSQVTDMNRMFQNCTVLTDGNVRLIGRHPNVNTTDMIYGSGLTREPWYNADGTPREVVEITLGTELEAREQFRAALTARGLEVATVTEVPFEIELVGTGSATQMFYNCQALTKAPEMDTSGVTHMKDMFRNCSSLISVPDLDTSNVTSMEGMFDYCSSLTTVPAMNTGSVTNMAYMFYGCSSITTVPVMDTAQATNMSYMFQYCSSLTHVPDMDTSQVTNARNMFFNCSSLTDGNVRLIGRHPQVDTTLMIYGSGLTREPWYNADGTPREVVEITLGASTEARDQLRAALSDRGLNYERVTEIPFDIKLVGTGSARALFQFYGYITHAPNLDTSGVTNMSSMFRDCYRLTTVPEMDTSRVTTMAYMFRDSRQITYVPDMVTSQVTDMNRMFYNCSALTDGNVRLIGRNPNVITTSMTSGSGLTRAPFYDTNGNPI